MSDTATYEIIERYLLGKLPAAERAELEARLAADPELAEQFARQKQEHLALGLLVEDDLRSRLDRWKTERPLPAYPPWLPAALLFLAVAALLTVFTWWLSTSPARNPAPPQAQPNQPVATTPASPVIPTETPAPGVVPETPVSQAINYLALAAEFDEPVRYGDGIQRAGTAGADTVEMALQLLRKKRYAKARTLLRALPPDHPRYPDAQYYRGLALYDQKRFQRAIPFLKKTADAADYLYADRAAWFLTLAYLQNDQLNLARQLARKIAADEGHPYREKAAALLRRL